MEIRAFTDQDLPAAGALFARVFRGEPWEEPWTDHSATLRVRYFFEQKEFIGYVAYKGDRLLGFVLGNLQPWLDEWQYRIEEFCVDPDQQKRKVGSQIINQLHTSLKARGIESVNLITSPDGPAYRFFIANGFVETARAAFMSQTLY